MMVMIIRSGDDNDSCNYNSIYVMRINQTALHLKRWPGCKVGMCLPVVGLSVGRGVWRGNGGCLEGMGGKEPYGGMGTIWLASHRADFQVAFKNKVPFPLRQLSRKCCGL